jgi:hypothetical protein
MRLIAAIGLLAAATGIAPVAEAQATAPAEPYVVEYYYKVKWGFTGEFLALFRKNHYPVLKREMELGRIVSVSAVEPRYHATEDARWDYRVTITFRSVADAFAPALNEQEMRKLYPDKATFDREEQRRFELLLAHWDVPIRTLVLQP